MELIYLIMFFGWFSLMLNTSGRSGGRKIPMPPEHLRTKKKEGVPKMKNPPLPPKKCVGITLHGRIYRPEFPKDRIT